LEHHALLHLVHLFARLRELLLMAIYLVGAVVLRVELSVVLHHMGLAEVVGWGDLLGVAVMVNLVLGEGRRRYRRRQDLNVLLIVMCEQIINDDFTLVVFLQAHLIATIEVIVIWRRLRIRKSRVYLLHHRFGR
jgi:hypothetical protein